MRTSPVDRAQIVDMMLMKRCNNIIQRVLHKQTQVNRAGRGPVSLGVNLMGGLEW